MRLSCPPKLSPKFDSMDARCCHYSDYTGWRNVQYKDRDVLQNKKDRQRCVWKNQSELSIEMMDHRDIRF